MKKFLILICVVLPQILCAQIQVDIADMTISKLKKDCKIYKITNGVDTTTIETFSIGNSCSPFLELKVRLRNTSDTIINLHSEKLELSITYYFEGKSYDAPLDSRFDTDNEDGHSPKFVILNPNEECYLISYGYIAKHPRMIVNFSEQNDNTNNVMRILPTMKLHVLNRDTNQKFIHDNIFDVKIMKRPFSSTLSPNLLPEGYYSIVE